MSLSRKLSEFDLNSSCIKLPLAETSGSGPTWDLEPTPQVAHGLRRSWPSLGFQNVTSLVVQWLRLSVLFSQV